MLRIFRKKDISKSNSQSGKMVTLTSPLGERMPAGQVRGRFEPLFGCSFYYGFTIYAFGNNGTAQGAGCRNKG